MNIVQFYNNTVAIVTSLCYNAIIMKGWTGLIPIKLASKRVSAMAFPQILSLPAPLGRNPSLKRRLSNRVKKFKNAALSRIKSVRKYAKNIAKHHYFIATALRDLKSAAAKNEDIVVSSVASSFVLAYACAAISLESLIAISRITYALSEATGYDMGILIFIFAPMLALFAVLLTATAFNFLSLALMDGANRRIYRSILTTFARSLNAASRITGAWFLMAIVHGARFLAVVIPLGVYIKFFYQVAYLPYEVLASAALVGGLWIISGILKYSLVPYVALYEPKLLLNEAFTRSRQLVNFGAKVFIVTLFVALIFYCVGLYIISIYLKAYIGLGTNLMLAMGILAGVILANGGMAMLYRKRKMARR